MRKGDLTGGSVCTPGPKIGARRSLGPLTVIAELSFLPNRPAQEQPLEQNQLWYREDAGSCSAPAMRQGYAKEGKAKKTSGPCMGGVFGRIAQAQRRLRDAPGASSLFPLGPVGGAPRRPERRGGGCWRPNGLSGSDHGRSARNLRPSVPSAVDCRGPVPGAGLDPCGREERLKIVQ